MVLKKRSTTKDYDIVECMRMEALRHVIKKNMYKFPLSIFEPTKYNLDPIILELIDAN